MESHKGTRYGRGVMAEPVKPKTEFGKGLQQRRLPRGWSQVQMAQFLEMTTPAEIQLYCRWDRGDSEPPKAVQRIIFRVIDSEAPGKKPRKGKTAP